MATYGLIADIHGNVAALKAVLAVLERRGVDQILCLGDIVGYNAEPNECIEILKQRGIEAIAGNHDLIAIGRLRADRCANKVIYALRRTRRRLSPPSRSYLAALPASRVYGNVFALIHGGVDDVEYYMRTVSDIRLHAARFRARFSGIGICFFGHIHEQKIYEITGAEVTELFRPPESFSNERLYFVNPGSADAARKSGERKAQCAVFDTDARRVEFLDVEYDHASAEGRAAALGYRIGPGMAGVYGWCRRVKRWLARVSAIGEPRSGGRAGARASPW
ncbi:MAG: metallophosphoesterase family protein [Nitrospirae bacterium]|nr:metallophosphoesterase family protein [Nitrospirota bacterium]